jgi:hypothetical protein
MNKKSGRRVLKFARAASEATTDHVPENDLDGRRKKAQSEKSMRARIEAAAAYKGCTAEELAAMPESELLRLQNLGRKTVDFLQNPGRGDPLQSPNPRKP